MTYEKKKMLKSNKVNTNNSYQHKQKGTTLPFSKHSQLPERKKTLKTISETDQIIRYLFMTILYITIYLVWLFGRIQKQIDQANLDI